MEKFTPLATNFTLPPALTGWTNSTSGTHLTNLVSSSIAANLIHTCYTMCNVQYTNRRHQASSSIAATCTIPILPTPASQSLLHTSWACEGVTIVKCGLFVQTLMISFCRIYGGVGNHLTLWTMAPGLGWTQLVLVSDMKTGLGLVIFSCTTTFAFQGGSKVLQNPFF